MPEFVACPVCGSRVQMSEALLGRRVRCLSCSQTFVAVPDTSPPQGPPPERPVPRRARPVLRRDLPPDSVEAKLPFCPGCGKPVHWEDPRCPSCGEEFEGEGESEAGKLRPGVLVRRDVEPHRGNLLATLGNVCLVVGGLSICLFGLGSLVSVPLGIATWVMANHDLKRIHEGAMDPFGKELTETGRTGAILGIVLGVIFACCHALWWSHVLW